MITPRQALDRYGSPIHESAMILWDVPSVMERSAIPGKIYLNRDLRAPLADAIVNLIVRNHIDELKTWDGCFNIRHQKGSSQASLHSWGLAIDVNAAWNPLGAQPKLTKGFVACFEDAGFEWGGHWDRPDGMHFQLREFPA
jgi:hypothetical protein